MVLVSDPSRACPMSMTVAQSLRRLLLALFSCRSKRPKRTGRSSPPPRSQSSHRQPSTRRAGEQQHQPWQHQLRQQQQQGAGASLFDASFWNSMQSSGGLGETSSGPLNFASPQIRFAPLIRAASDGESHPPHALPVLALGAHPFANVDNVPVDEICLSSDRTIFEKVPSEIHRPCHCCRTFCSCAHMHANCWRCSLVLTWCWRSG